MTETEAIKAMMWLSHFGINAKKNRSDDGEWVITVPAATGREKSVYEDYRALMNSDQFKTMMSHANKHIDNIAEGASVDDTNESYDIMGFGQWVQSQSEEKR